MYHIQYPWSNDQKPVSNLLDQQNDLSRIRARNALKVCASPRALLCTKEKRRLTTMFMIDVARHLESLWSAPYRRANGHSSQNHAWYPGSRKALVTFNNSSSWFLTSYIILVTLFFNTCTHTLSPSLALSLVPCFLELHQPSFPSSSLLTFHSTYCSCLRKKKRVLPRLYSVSSYTCIFILARVFAALRRACSWCILARADEE